MTSFELASGEIYALIYEAWKSNSFGVVGYVPEIRWQGLTERTTPDGSKFWVRVSLQTVFESQTALSNSVQAPGKKRYTISGLVFAQLFCPKSDAQTYAKGKKLAVILRNSLRGKTTASSIWFKNARINELEPEELYERFNVITEFEYDELG